MQRGMRYVALGMRADKIVQFMWDAGLTEVPVLDADRRPVGLISLGELIAAGRAAEARGEQDSVLALLDPVPGRPSAIASKRVEDIMVFGIPTIHESLPLANAASRMLGSDRECLVVVDDHGTAVGSLSMPDMMRWLVDQTATNDGALADAEPVTPGIELRKQ
jgi:CBS domain-containing protein